MQSRLFWRFKIICTVKTDKKPHDQLIFMRHLISLKVIFYCTRKAMNYTRGQLNTLITFSDYYKVKQVKSVQLLFLVFKSFVNENHSVFILLKSLMQECYILIFLLKTIIHQLRLFKKVSFRHCSMQTLKIILRYCIFQYKYMIVISESQKCNSSDFQTYTTHR